jgi:adhesin/invasin
VNVTFAVAGGGGSITGAAQVTGADGIATLGSWTLGQLVGANSVTATAAAPGLTGNPATFTATGTVGLASILAKLAGDNQTALSGAAVPVAPSVKLTDAFGNPIASQTITFAVASGGGSLTGATPTTAATGIANLGSWVLGAAGTNTVNASAGALTTTFTATSQALLNAPQYNGTYSGTWTNTTFASTGTGQAVVAVNSGASTASVTVTVTGNVLGTGGVPVTARNGAYGATSAAFAGNVPVMGDITATIDASGHIIASGINVPNAGISRWDANGTITATTLTLNFTVTFTAGSPAIGTINLVKGP